MPSTKADDSEFKAKDLKFEANSKIENLKPKDTVNQTPSLAYTNKGWLRSTVGRASVFGRRTDPILRSTFS